MQLFSAERKFRFFFDPENMKKPPSKVAHNQPPMFCQAAQTAQKQKSRTTKSPLKMQNWVFRLGIQQNVPSLSL